MLGKHGRERTPVYRDGGILSVAVFLLLFPICGMAAEGGGLSRLEGFIRQLSSCERAERLQATSSLGKLGKDAAPAVGQLVRYLDSWDTEFRVSVVGALGEIGDDAAVDALIDRLDNPPGSRLVVVSALRKITGQSFGEESGAWRDWRRTSRATRAVGASEAYRCATATCHDSLGLKGQATHKPVRDGECLRCHKPSKAFTQDAHTIFDFDFAEGQQMCLECHPSVAAKLEKSKVVHEPVSHGVCDACHNPHGSPVPHFLKVLCKPVGTALIPGVDLGVGAHCMSCHHREAFLEESLLESRFRRGKQNLHWVHVAPAKGSSVVCTECHDTHASSLPRLVKQKEKDDAVGALVFRVTEQGGSCESSCHVAQSYEWGKAKP